MNVYTKRAREIFAPTDAAGNLRSVSNAETQVWGTEVERGMDGAAAGRVDAASWADLSDITGDRAGQPAIVYGPDAGTHTDPVTGQPASNEGIYAWSVSPAGWRRVGNVQSELVHAVNSGAGTADSVQATVTGSFNQNAYASLITVNFRAANTGAMTLSINGETPRPLVTNTGDPIPTGYVEDGMSALVQIDEAGNYRLFSYGDSDAAAQAAEAAQQAAEAAQAAAEAARDAALAAVPNAFPPNLPSLKALPDTVTAAYLTEAGREGQFLWRAGDYSMQVATDTKQAIYIKADEVAATSGAWVRVGSWHLTGIDVRWFGATGDGVTDDTDALDAAFAFAEAFGLTVVIRSGTYLVNVDKPFQGEHGDTWCSFYVRSKSRIVGIDRPVLKIKDGCSTDVSPLNYNMFSGNAVYENILFQGIVFDMGGLGGANTISPNRYQFGKVTIYNGSPGMFTWPGNTPVEGKKVRFHSTGTLPPELDSEGEYFIGTVFGDGSFYVRETVDGPNIGITNTGTGTRTMREDGSYAPYNCAALYIGGIDYPGLGSGVDARVNGLSILDCEVRNSPGVSCIITGSGYGGHVLKSSNVRIERCRFWNNGLDSYDHSSIFLWANSSIIFNCEFDHPTLSQGVKGPVCAFELHGIGNKATHNYVNNYIQGAYACATSYGNVLGNIIKDNTFRVLWRGIVTWLVSPINKGLEGIQIGQNDILIYPNEIENHRAPLPKVGYTISSDDGPLRSVQVVGGSVRSYESTQGVVGVAVYSKATGDSVLTEVDVSGVTMRGITRGATVGGFVKSVKMHGNIMKDFFIGEPFSESVGIETTVDLLSDEISLVCNIIGEDGNMPNEGLRLKGSASGLTIDLNSIHSTGIRINEDIVANRRRGLQATTFPDLAAIGARWPLPEDGAFAWSSDGSERGSGGSKYTIDGWRYAGVGGWIERRALSGN